MPTAAAVGIAIASAPGLDSLPLCDLEVAAAIRRGLRQRRMDERRGRQAIDHYLGLPLTLHSHRPLLGRILQLRDRLTVYDASYLALAERLRARLLTTDGDLAATARAIGVPVVEPAT